LNVTQPRGEEKTLVLITGPIYMEQMVMSMNSKTVGEE